MGNFRHTDVPVVEDKDAQTVLRWVVENFLSIERIIVNNEVSTTPTFSAILLSPLPTAPASPIEGMLVNANGTTWDPGDGAGLYEYRGGAWVRPDQLTWG